MTRLNSPRDQAGRSTDLDIPPESAAADVSTAVAATHVPSIPLFTPQPIFDRRWRGFDLSNTAAAHSSVAPDEPDDGEDKGGEGSAVAIEVDIDGEVGEEPAVASLRPSQDIRVRS